MLNKISDYDYDSVMDTQLVIIAFAIITGSLKLYFSTFRG